MAEENVIETAAAKRVALLIDATLGEGDTAITEGWTNYNSPIDYDTSRYWPFPRNAADVKLPKIEGTAAEGVFTWLVPRVGVFAQYGYGVEAYPVQVRIDECDPSDPQNTRRRVYWAKVESVLVNPAGETGLVELRLRGVKADLEAPLGIVALPTCPWVFMDKTCCVPRYDKEFPGTVTAIETTAGEETIVTVAFDEYANEYAGDPQHDPRKWRNGYIEKNGCRIRIRAKDEYAYQFTLSNAPPADWLDAEVLAVYGCDQELPTCRDVWGNERRFVALGIKMPDQNRTVFERP